jgi:putative phosphoesterase
MRIGLIADIHGNHLAFACALNYLKNKVERILFAGDLAGYYPYVRECMELWDDDFIVSVRGNHDQILLDCIAQNKLPDSEYTKIYGNALHRTLPRLTANDIDRLQSWEDALNVIVDGIRFAVFHGAPWDELHGRVYPDFQHWQRFHEIAADVVVLGQTHYAMERVFNSKIIVNPGSIGQPRDKRGPFACFADIDTRTLKIKFHRIRYDARLIIEDMKNHNPKMDSNNNLIVK